MALSFTEVALKDIKESYNYYLEINSIFADNFINAINKTIDIIEAHPNMGKPSPKENIRQLSVPKFPFVIPYETKESNILILRVWHTKREIR